MSKEEIAKAKKAKKITTLITWGPIAAILGIIVIYLVSQVAAAFIIGLYPVARHMSSAQATNWLENSVNAEFWVTVLVESISVFLLGLFLRHRKSNFQSLGLKGRPKLTDLGYVLVGFCVYFLTYDLVVTLAQKAIPSLISPTNKQDIGFSSSTTGLALVLVFVSLVILPPIVEEMLFRGFLYSGLRSKLPKITAALITSAIFASLHLIEGTGGILWIAGIDTFILSMVLIYLREKTDKLWASMGLHMLKNFVAFASIFIFHLS